MQPEDATPDAQPASLSSVLGAMLALSRLAILQLFALPGDPVPQAVTRLTGLTQDEVQRLARLTSDAELDHLLRHEAAAFYYFLLVGWLACDSPVGEAIHARMLNAGSEAQAQQLAVLELVIESLLPDLAACVPAPTAAPTAELRALFAQEKYSLAACLPAIVASPTSSPEVVEEGVWMSMHPNQQERNLFRLALQLTHAASYGVDHPLGRALADVPALGTSAELIGLAQRFGPAPPDAKPPTEAITLNGPDLIRLYLSLQVLALLYVAELQPELMKRLNPTLNTDGPWDDHDQQQLMLEWVCTQVEAFSIRFDELFGEEPTYQAAQATAHELAALM